MTKAWVDPGILKKSIASVTALVDEAKIRFGPSGLRIQTVDEANVGAISLDLLEEAFYDYEADGLEIHLDLQRLEEIINRATDRGNFIISIDEEAQDLTLASGGYEFEVSLLSPDAGREGPDPRELEGQASVAMEGSEFSEAINMASMFSDQLRMGIDVSNDIFFMNAEGDSDSMHVTLDQEDLIELEVEKAYGRYSLNYLNSIQKPIPGDKKVRVGLGEEMPLKIQYEVANGNGRISYGLAPRI